MYLYSGMLSDVSSIILSDTNSDRYSQILPVEENRYVEFYVADGEQAQYGDFQVIYCTLPPESMNVLAYP